MNLLPSLAVLAALGLLATTGALAQPSGAVPAYCVASSGGGAAPPDLLDGGQTVAVKSIVARYRADNLTESDARAIRQALHDAGLRQGAALDRALAEAGFSAKRLDALAPCPALAPPALASAATGRKVPPRQ